MSDHAERQLDIEDLLKEPEGDYDAHALAPSRSRLDAILAPQRYP